MLRALISTAILLLPAATTIAQPADERVLREGWYVVRPGDTLEDITARYLGDSQRWRENWRLNPEVENPNRIRPGQRLRILFRQLPDDGAAVTKLANEVENKRPPIREWRDADRFDLMRSRDSLRTGERSSAELEFGDTTRLLVSEASMVFLERMGQRPEINPDQIEIELGQADFEGTMADAGDSGIELVIGDAKAAPRAGADGQVRTRARKAVEGDAQLMVFQGASELAAGGAKVEVAEGMGSTAAAGQTPTPPEKLLDAPRAVEPAAGARLANPRPTFSWRAVAGSRSYVLEVCRDVACGELVDRATGLTETGWQPADKLPVAELHWRVSAVSASGLDGYASTARPFTVLTEDEDTAPPTVALQVGEPSLPPRYGINASWILGVGAQLEAMAEDADSGVERWLPLLDGEEVSVEAWQGPWTPGEHRVAFAAFDRAGNRAVLEEVPFVYDTKPPGLTWGVETVGPKGRLDPDAEAGQLPPRGSRETYRVDDPHSWLPWRRQVWQVDRDPRQVVLRPNRPVRVRIGGQEVALTPEQGLWVLAEDAVCDAVYQLDYQLDLAVAGRRGDRRSELVLRVRAVDGVDNVSHGRLEMSTAKPR